MKRADNNSGNVFSDKVGKDEKRKLKALSENKRSVWFGLGMFGMVGWSVAVPALAGAFCGLWLDRIYHQSFSWTLSLLLAGLFIGCLIAWYWIAKENREMHQNENDNNNDE